MYRCFTALLSVALADVAIFISYYSVPVKKKSSTDEMKETHVVLWITYGVRKKTKKNKPTLQNYFFYQKGSKASTT